MILPQINMKAEVKGEQIELDDDNWMLGDNDSDEENYEDDADFAPMPIVDNGFDDY